LARRLLCPNHGTVHSTTHCSSRPAKPAAFIDRSAEIREARCGTLGRGDLNWAGRHSVSDHGFNLRSTAARAKFL
jgi:hypothetical protein